MAIYVKPVSEPRLGCEVLIARSGEDSFLVFNQDKLSYTQALRAAFDLPTLTSEESDTLDRALRDLGYPLP